MKILIGLFLSSNVPPIRPLTSISFHISSIYFLFGRSYALLTCRTLIISTCRTGASTGTHDQNIEGGFLASSFMGLHLFQQEHSHFSLYLKSYHTSNQSCVSLLYSSLVNDISIQPHFVPYNKQTNKSLKFFLQP